MSHHNHLTKYPYLLNFCKEEDILIVSYSYPYEQLLLSDIVASSIPDQSIDGFESRKKVIDKCLEFGHRHGILDNNRRSRLKRKDPVQFWSTVSEMKIGVWLEEQGIKIIGFEPPSENGGKGDYLIQGNGHIVFIEVKTLFGESYMLEQERLTGDIAQHCQNQKLPVESVNLVHYSRDYDYANNKCRLLREVEELIRNNLPLTERRTVSYSEPNGIEIEIELDPDASRVLSMMYGGFSGLKDDLKIKLDVCVIGKRKLQTSAKNIPSICIIDDLHHNINRIIIEDVLYGTLVESHTQPQKVKYYRENNGKWTSTSPSELSSVFVLKFKPTTMRIQTLDAYLCPKAKYELSKSVFSKAKIEWWSLDKNGIFVKAPSLLNKLYLLSALFKSLIKRCYRFILQRVMTLHYRQMLQAIFSRLGEFAVWLIRWYVNRVIVSWRREVRRLRGVENKWVWICLSIFFALFLFPYLAKEAFSDSFLLGLSFIWSSFLAISFAYILRNPLLMILVYVGVVFGREVINLFSTAKEEATSGNLIGALIIFALGIYLITWANRMKKGEI